MNVHSVFGLCISQSVEFLVQLFCSWFFYLHQVVAFFVLRLLNCCAIDSFARLHNPVEFSQQPLGLLQQPAAGAFELEAGALSG